MSFNETLYTKDQKTELLKAVAKAIQSGDLLDFQGRSSCGWANAFYTATPGSPISKVLDDLNLEYKVYLGIHPVVRFYRSNVSTDYKVLELDLRGFDVLDPDCQHVPIELEWEKGDGGPFSGTDFSHQICSKCFGDLSQCNPNNEASRGFFRSLSDG